MPHTARTLAAMAAIAVAAAMGAAARAQPAPLRPFDHLFLIVLENRSYDQVAGNPDMPTLNALAASYGLAADDHGTAHPSLPNYVDLISGGSWGSRSDDPAQAFDRPNLADQLEAAGLTWKAYMQAIPHPGFLGAAAGVGGLYAKKHDPFLLFPSIADDPARARRVVPLTQLTADLANGAAPTFAFIVPDQCHDMHGTSVCQDRTSLDRTGDAFVGTWVRAIMASSAWSGNAAIVVTFDEAPQGLATLIGKDDNHIFTLVIARQGPRRAVLRTRSDHDALLRTLEQAWGLPYLGAAATAADMEALFH